VLFRKDYEALNNCLVCKASRWKDPVNKKVPEKVLRHFPLIPRLQWIFGTKKTSEEVKWHKLNTKRRKCRTLLTERHGKILTNVGHILLEIHVTSDLA